MNFAKYAIENRVIMFVFTFLTVFGGIISFNNMGRLEDPEFTIKQAVIYTYYPGASAKQVEEEVTDKIEIAVQKLGQLKHVTSISKKGLSIVEVEIKASYDKETLPQVWDELRRKVGDMSSRLPPGAGVPMVFDDFGDVYGILFSVTGEGFSYRELKDYVDLLQKQLLIVDQVAKVEIRGVQDERIYVEISRTTTANMGISPRTVYSSLRRHNMIIPSGEVRVGREYIRLSPYGTFKTVEDIENLLISDKNERLIYLKDIATVKRGYVSPPRTPTRYNGKLSLVIGISIVKGGNVVVLGEEIKKKLASLESQRPVGMEIHTISFQGDLVTDAINDFLLNLVEAVAIVIFILLIFMGLRSGFIIGSILFLIILATFIVMNVLDINLQRISLGALIIALGMLVDNAIVVTDGVLIGIQNGVEKKKAAMDIVSRTMYPLLGATIIAILAFAGIGLSQDATGEFCKSLFQVILISLSLSWLFAITLIPLFCVLILKVPEKQGNEDPYGGSFYTKFRNILDYGIKKSRYAVIIMLALLGFAVVGFANLGSSFFPPAEKSQFLIDYWLPEGTDVRKTSEDLRQVEKDLLKRKEVRAVATTIGQGTLRFMLTYPPEKNFSSYGLLLVEVKDQDEIDRLIGELDVYFTEHWPDAMVIMKKFALGGVTPRKIEVRFSGPDLEVLRDIASDAQNIMADDPHTVGIQSDWRERVKVYRPNLSDSKAKRIGITKRDINSALQRSFVGSTVGLYRERDKLIPIVSRAPDNERSDMDNISAVQVWSPVAQKSVPMTQVISGFTTEFEDGIIRRRNRLRTITAQCEPAPGMESSTILERIMPKIDAIKLPTGYFLEWGGEYEKSNDARAAVGGNLPVTFLLMVLIIIILFNNLKQPTIIVLTVPLALIGVTIGLGLTGQSFGFMAMLGFLSLTGMLIKNSIVLLDEINIQIDEGKKPYTATIDSAVSRMRPVSMAALTTVLGMFPLVFDNFYVGMAVTIMAGLTFATILTLIFVPILYTIFYKI